MSVAVLLALATLGGAGDSEHAALREARQHWRAQRARDYSYVLRRSCFCVPSDPVRIRVVNRRPRDTPEEFKHVDTAKELFAEAARALRSEGEHTVRYRPRRGLPILITADPIVNAADEEFSYRITKLRITRRHPPIGG
jgi:uncharacterized protein DUF6174